MLIVNQCAWKIKKFILILMGLSSISYAQQPLSGNSNSVKVLKLDECIFMALQRNLDIDAAKIEPKIRRKDVEIADAVFNPVFNASIGVQNSLTEMHLPFGFSTNIEVESSSINAGVSGALRMGTKYSLEITSQKSDNSPSSLPVNPFSKATPKITVSQPLLKGRGRYINEAGVLIALRGTEAARQQTIRVIMEIISNVKSAYYKLSHAIEAVSLAKSSLARAEELLEIVRERYSKGLASNVDLLEIEAAVAARQKGIISVESAKDSADDYLKTLINIIDTDGWNASILPSDKPVIEQRNIIPEICISNALAFRPEYKAKLLELSIKEIQSDVAENADLPSLDLTGSYAFNGVGEDRSEALSRIGDGSEWFAGVSFSVPWKGPEKSKKVQKYMEREKISAELKSLQQKIVMELREKIRNVSVQKRNVNAAGIVMEKEKQNYWAQRKRYETGQISVHDLLEYQDKLAAAETDYLDAIINYQIALIELEKAEGTTLQRNNIVLEGE